MSSGRADPSAADAGAWRGRFDEQNGDLPIDESRPRRSEALALLRVFPSHEGLCLLLRVCGQLAALRVDAPLTAYLTGAELIVTKGQEWEVNAPKALQLGEALSGVSALVARWRKLELASWGALLRQEEVEEARGAGAAEVFLALRAAVLELPPPPPPPAPGAPSPSDHQKRRRA